MSGRFGPATRPAGAIDWRVPAALAPSGMSVSYPKGRLDEHASRHIPLWGRGDASVERAQTRSLRTAHGQHSAPNQLRGMSWLAGATRPIPQGANGPPIPGLDDAHRRAGTGESASQERALEGTAQSQFATNRRNGCGLVIGPAPQLHPLSARGSKKPSSRGSNIGRALLDLPVQTGLDTGAGGPRAPAEPPAPGADPDRHDRTAA